MKNRCNSYVRSNVTIKMKTQNPLIHVACVVTTYDSGLKIWQHTPCASGRASMDTSEGVF
jgi:hypothetical protein